MCRFQYLYIFLAFLLSCHQEGDKQIGTEEFGNESSSLFRIAFGSCNHQDKKQFLWDDVLASKPDLWIWLGDNIYGDSEDTAVLRTKYRVQKSDSLYTKLRNACPIIGTWDDHDYGVNDGGKEFPMKVESQNLLLDFLDVPINDKRRNREGVYFVHTIEKDGVSVKFYVFDTRFFRDSLLRVEGRIIPNTNGQILGDEQWQWFLEELQKPAKINILCSSIQVLPEEHVWEKWSNFPNERTKLLNILDSLQIPNTFIISGDRHMGEISKIKMENIDIVEITSSSMTHSLKQILGNIQEEESNKYRVGSIVFDENYATIDIMQRNDSLYCIANILLDSNIVAQQIEIYCN